MSSITMYILLLFRPYDEMELDHEKIERIVSGYATNGKKRTVASLVDVFSGGVKIKKDLLPNEREKFIQKVGEIYDILHTKGFEGREILMEYLIQRLDESCEKTLKFIRAGQKRIIDLFRLGREPGPTPFESLISESIDYARKNIHPSKMNQKDIQRYIIGLVYDGKKTDYKKITSFETFCKSGSLDHIYDIISMLQDATLESEKRQSGLLKSLEMVVLSHLPEPTDNAESFIKALFENMDSMKIDQETREQFMTLLPVLVMHPKLNILFREGLADQLYEKIIDYRMQPMDDNRVYPYSLPRSPKKRLQLYLRLLQKSDLMEIVANRPRQRARNIIDMITSIQTLLAQEKSSVILAKSKLIQKRLSQLLLPDHYESMIKNHHLDGEGIYYLLGYIDMIQDDESYYVLAQEFKEDMIDRLKAKGFSYREVGEVGDWYIAEKGMIPLNQPFCDYNKEGERGTREDTYTWEQSEQKLLQFNMKQLKCLGTWKHYLKMYSYKFTDPKSIYHLIIHCTSLEGTFPEMRWSDENIQCVFDFIISFDTSDQSRSLSILLSLGRRPFEEFMHMNSVLSDENVNVTTTTITNFIQKIGVKNIYPLLWVNSLKMKTLIKAFGSQKLEDHVLEIGAKEIAEFVGQLSESQIADMPKRYWAFSYIAEVGGKNLGKLFNVLGSDPQSLIQRTIPFDKPVIGAQGMLLGHNEPDRKAFLLSLIQADPSKISKAIATYGPERFASFEVKDAEISRCGTSLDKLTDKQKELLKKLTPEQVRELSQKVRINHEEGQIEFFETARGPMAIQDKDYIPSDDGADEMNSDSYERTLPLDKNTRNSPQERSMLDPKLSDFDAMIVQMAGETYIHKIENFMQLTGMDGCYKTGSSAISLSGRSTGSSYYIIRTFSKDGHERDLLGAFVATKSRLIRRL